MPIGRIAPASVTLSQPLVTLTLGVAASLHEIAITKLAKITNKPIKLGA